MIDESAFYDRNPGLKANATSELNAYLQAAFSDAEVSRLSQYLDAETAASIPGSKPEIRELPAGYVELLTLSNGGGISIGDREIAFFKKQSLREYLVEYQFPIYMPAALPFGLNGGGVFYVFDMRKPATNAEYPILAAASGNLSYDDAPTIAHSMHELFADKTNIEDLL